MAISTISSAGLAAGGIGRTNMYAGAVLQVVNVTSGAYASTTTVVPIDDTIPQNTEGAEFFTLSITPTNATSKLLIQLVVQTSNTGGGWLTVGLFQDTTANALASASTYNNISTAANTQVINHYMTSGTTSSTTFKLRYGPNSGTAVVNGSGATRNFGGTSSTSMTITEIAA